MPRPSWLRFAGAGDGLGSVGLCLSQRPEALVAGGRQRAELGTVAQALRVDDEALLEAILDALDRDDGVAGCVDDPELAVDGVPVADLAALGVAHVEGCTVATHLLAISAGDVGVLDAAVLDAGGGGMWLRSMVNVSCGVCPRYMMLISICQEEKCWIDQSMVPRLCWRSKKKGPTG